MMNKLKDNLKNRTVWMLCFISAAAGAVYGFTVKPFFLHFIDGLTMTAVFLLFFGIMRWAYIRGDFAYFSWRQEKGSYTRYRQNLIEERKESKNPALPAGLILLIISIILAFLY